jgi:hypothetical protein
MSYLSILELTARISAESSPEQKIALLEELRRQLNEEQKMLHANLETFFPCARLSDQFPANPPQAETPLLPDPMTLRKHAEALRMKAVNFIQEADMLAMRAESLEKAAPMNVGAKTEKPTVQAAKAA